MKYIKLFVLLPLFSLNVAIADECSQYKQVAQEAKKHFHSWFNSSDKDLYKTEDYQQSSSTFTLEGVGSKDDCKVTFDYMNENKTETAKFECTWKTNLNSDIDADRIKLEHAVRKMADGFASCFGVKNNPRKNFIDIDDVGYTFMYEHPRYIKFAAEIEK